jgi:hypothetical protein
MCETQSTGSSYLFAAGLTSFKSGKEFVQFVHTLVNRVGLGLKPLYDSSMLRVGV